MVCIGSIETRGLEVFRVLRVFEVKQCDCAGKQTEANDSYMAHRDLGWPPEFL